MFMDNREMLFALQGKQFHCALDITIIGGKWKTIVLWYLRKQPKRFSELQKHITGIMEKC